MANNTSAIRQVRPGPVEQTPYVGPRPFGLEDRDIFFGRNQEAIELTSLIKAHPEVLLYAPSGAGKSSLIYAQVIPILKEEEDFDVLPAARVRSQDSAAIPDEIKNIYIFNALKDLSDNSLSVTERANMTLADYLKLVPRPPVRSSPNVEQDPGTLNPDIPVETRLARVIIFDQFEEIFTLYPERYKDRQDFFCQVADALKADPFLRVVFSMREDYIAELDPYIYVLPEKLRTGFRLERLRQPNARSAVKEPLKSERVKNTGRRFADGVAESLVESLMLIKVKTASGEKKEVPGEFVDPVQLQVVCQTLWEKLPKEESIITTEHLEKYANVEEALSDFYESSIRKAVATYNATIESSGTESVPVSKMTEGEVRGWFEKALITREGKRNMVLRERQMTGGLINPVVDELENQHLVRVEMRGGEPWYELSHDRFITPIRESNRRWLLEQPWAAQKARELETRAAEWLAANRDSSMLLDRPSLAEAKIWISSPEAKAIGYSETLYAFIKASEVAIEHEDRKYERALVAEQESRMLAEHRRARQFKLGLVVVSVFLMFAFASAVYGFINGNRAESNRAKAEAALKAATAAKETAEDQRVRAEKTAEELAKEKEKVEQFADNLELAKTEEEKARKKAEADRRLAQTLQAKADAAHRQANFRNILLEQKQGDLTEAVSQMTSTNLAREAQLSNDPVDALLGAIAAWDIRPTQDAKYSLRLAYKNLRAKKESTILKGHKDDTVLNKAVYSPFDGSIITISEDGRASIFDAKNYKLQRVLDNKAPVHALEVGKNGIIATELGNGTGAIWKNGDDKPIILNDLTGPVAALALSPDGNLVAAEATSPEPTATRANEKRGATPRIWDTDGHVKQTLVGHESAVSALAFSPNGDRLVTASWDKTARVWDVSSGREITSFRQHKALLTSVAFNTDGDLLVTGSNDGTARIWVAATGEETRVLQGPVGTAVRNVSFSPNGRFVLGTISANFSHLLDNTVWIWDVKTGQASAILMGHAGEVNSARFSSNNSLIVTASDDGTSRVWKTDTGENVAEFRGHVGSVKSALFNSTNEYVVTAGADGTAQVWSTRDTGLKTQINSVIPRSANFTSDGRSVVALERQSPSSSEGKTYISMSQWDLTGKPLSRSDNLDLGVVSDVAISPKGRFIVTGSKRSNLRRSDVTPTDTADTKAHVWDLLDTRTSHSLGDYKRPVNRVLFSPKGNYVLTISSDLADIWNTSEWQNVRQLNPSTVERDAGPILGAVFDAEEKYLITTHFKGTIHIWEIATGLNICVQQVHERAVRSVAISTNGDLIVTSSDDGTAKIWNTVMTEDGKRISSLKILTTLTRHKGPLYDAQFSPNAELVVTSGIDGSVRIWESNSGDFVTEFKEPEWRPFSAAFSLDNSTVITRDANGVVYLFECEVCRPPGVLRELAKTRWPAQIREEEIKRRIPPL